MVRDTAGTVAMPGCSKKGSLRVDLWTLAGAEINAPAPERQESVDISAVLLPRVGDESGYARPRAPGVHTIDVRRSVDQERVRMNIVRE